MSNTFKTTVLIALLAYSIAPGLAAGASKGTAKSARGYHMRQNVLYQGALEVKAGDSGIRVDTKEFTLFFRPMVKGILMLNEQSKKYCLIDDKQWLEHNGGGFMREITKKGTSTYNDMKVDEYFGNVYDARGRWRYGERFWVTKDMKLPPSVVSTYGKVFSIPGGYGMALKVVRCYPTKVQIFLSTQKVEAAKVTAADTTPNLVGYQKVADEMEIMMADASDELNEILREEPVTRPQAKLTRRPR